MPKTNCKYHPRRLARWTCGECLINLCSGCVSREGDTGAPPRCPLCREPLSEIGTEHLIPAFWTRLPRFLAYPLQPRALSLLIGLTVVSWIIGYGGLLTLVLQFALFLLFYKQSYSALARTADGYPDPPAPLAVITGPLGPAIQQFLVFMILLAPIVLVSSLLGEAGRLVYLFVFVLVLPASVMVLAVTESIGEAINPAMIFGTVRRIGAPYLALLGVLFLLSEMPALFQGWLIEYAGRDLAALMEQAQTDPGGITPAALNEAKYAFQQSLQSWVIPLLILVRGYFTLVAFALMGYVMYQYHGRLGLSVAVDIEGDAEADANGHPLLGDIEVLIREGQLEEAARRLRERVVANRGDLALHDRFHRLLVATGDRIRCCGHGADYIGLLLAGTSPGRAAEIYHDCRRLDPAFELDSADQVLPLARVMFQVRDYAGVVALANGFHRKAPRHVDMPELYFLVAQSLGEGLGRDAQARPILLSLLKNYPDHPVAGRVRRYLDSMAMVATKPA